MKKKMYYAVLITLTAGLTGCGSATVQSAGSAQEQIVTETVSEETVSEETASEETVSEQAVEAEILSENEAEIETEVETLTKSGQLTPEGDAYILFDYSYQDGKNFEEGTDETLEKTVENGVTTYRYMEHVLSCGTHMNGEISEETQGDITTVKASFDVTNNKYEINSLMVDYTYDAATKTYDGILSMNGRKIDINVYVK